MRASALCVALIFSAAAVRAECHSAPECLLHTALGAPDFGGSAAVATGIAAGAVVVGGMVYSVASYELHAPDADVDRAWRAHKKLDLVPTELPPATGEGSRRDNRYLRFNENATNVMIGVTSAMILTGIILELAKHK